MVRVANIVPNPHMIATKIPDATPGIVSAYALTDVQSLLAKIRYNRLMDVFLGMTTYSLQSHLRMKVKTLGNMQIDIGEIYVGVNRQSAHFVLPVQVNDEANKVIVAQTTEDVTWCRKKYPLLRCRPVSAQLMADGVIALFELVLYGPEVKVIEERHYKLVPADQVISKDLKLSGNDKLEAVHRRTLSSRTLSAGR